MPKRKTRPASRQRTYRVVWEIDVDATSPKKAAMQARKCQEPGTTATTFDVYNEYGKCTRVDLGVVD
jgi:hypothetical protein